MLRISRLTDYAVALASTLAQAPEGSACSVRDLANATGIPHPTVSKILKQLTKHGLLISHRGVAGGYRLVRPAAQVSVADVVTAIEGKIALTDCSHDGTDGDQAAC